MGNPQEIRKPSHLEKEIYIGSRSTARSWIAAIQIFDLLLPLGDDVRLLDVGAGGSDVVAHFLDEEGVEAYALDPVYEGGSELVKRKVEEHFAEMARRSDHDRDWDAYFYVSRDTLEEFERSIVKHPNNYVNGYATSIPFPNDHFDVVVSLSCITEYLDQDKNLLADAVRESLRVTKPGGNVQLYPFGDRYVPAGGVDVEATKSYLAERVINQKALLLYLKSKGIRYEAIPVLGLNQSRLMIHKD